MELGPALKRPSFGVPGSLYQSFEIFRSIKTLISTSHKIVSLTSSYLSWLRSTIRPWGELCEQSCWVASMSWLL
ncbi:hypothetical protein CapIbe_004585 [Capra ibex]